MEAILHQLIGSISVQYIPLFTGFHTSQVVQDFFHQQHHIFTIQNLNLKSSDILGGRDPYNHHHLRFLFRN